MIERQRERERQRARGRKPDRKADREKRRRVFALLAFSCCCTGYSTYNIGGALFNSSSSAHVTASYSFSLDSFQLVLRSTYRILEVIYYATASSVVGSGALATAVLHYLCGQDPTYSARQRTTTESRIESTSYSER